MNRYEVFIYDLTTLHHNNSCYLSLLPNDIFLVILNILMKRYRYTLSMNEDGKNIILFETYTQYMFLDEYNLINIIFGAKSIKSVMKIFDYIYDVFFAKNGKLEFNQYVELFKPHSRNIVDCMKTCDNFIFTYEELKK